MSNSTSVCCELDWRLVLLRSLMMAAEFLFAESLEFKILTWLESREILINNQSRESFKSLILVLEIKAINQR